MCTGPIGITQIRTSLFGQRQHVSHNIQMLGYKIFGLSNIGLQVIQLSFT